MTALDLTGRGLIRALAGLTARPAVDRAVRQRAEAVARRVAAAGGVSAEAAADGEGAYTVTVSGPGLFAREFGSLDRPAEPVVGPAVDAMSAGPSALSSRARRSTK